MEKQLSNFELDLSGESRFSVLPLKDLVFFPHMVVPLIVGRPQSISAIEQAMSEEKIIFLVAQKEPGKDNVTPRDLYRFGVVARIIQLVKLPNGLLKILVEGIIRGRVSRYNNRGEHLIATIEIPFESVQMNDALEAKKRHLLALFKEYIKLNDEIPEEILFSLNQLTDIEKICDFIATYLDLPIQKKQDILKQWHVVKRADFIITILNKENRVLNLKSELDDKVREQMMKSQRNFFLQEQLRVIHDELGEEDGMDGEIALLKNKLASVGLPEGIHKKTLEEVQRLNRIPPMSPEYNVIRTYLEWIIALPWDNYTEDELRVKKAHEVLDADHFGLEKPKKRILEYIGVLQRVKRMQGPILCLSGPPGVGKTSLGKSIARALGRNFVRISLGGVNDEAEIRGHRRTYIGSMPGKIIQGLKKAGSVNPVFLLDEVDKLSHDYHGDPASALLEVLDPEQNRNFIDHYLEVEYDLSKVLFIVTANNPNEIPEALLDRMEIIELPGYIDDEKVEIARRHLITKQMEMNGLEAGELVIEDDALRKIIVNYTLEAGVRGLEREISKICRQTVVELSASSKKTKIVVSTLSLKKYLGESSNPLSKITTRPEVGIANGLAWTSYGGDMLQVEVNLLPGKDKLTLTGKLGEVMQESAMIALAYIRSKARKYKIQADFVNKYEIHIHLPEGAVPKDGPSAGITLTTALLSAIKKVPFPAQLAMTGEITLRGQVLPVGGLNEKLLAAKRQGIKRIILPAENKRDIRELNKKLLEGLELVYVNRYDQVYEEVFG